jgi:hypothetical protein
MNWSLSKLTWDNIQVPTINLVQHQHTMTMNFPPELIACFLWKLRFGTIRSETSVFSIIWNTWYYISPKARPSRKMSSIGLKNPKREPWKHGPNSLTGLHLSVDALRPAVHCHFLGRSKVSRLTKGWIFGASSDGFVRADGTLPGEDIKTAKHSITNQDGNIFSWISAVW